MTLGHLIRDYLDTLSGKITWRNFVYLLLPAPSRKRRSLDWKGEEFPTRVDADGRCYSMFKGRGAHCRHPTLWLGKYPRIDYSGRSHHIVPAADCKLCSFHEPARRHRKFACCAWDAEQHKGSPTPQQIAAGTMKAEAMVSGIEPVVEAKGE